MIGQHLKHVKKNQFYIFRVNNQTINFIYYKRYINKLIFIAKIRIFTKYKIDIRYSKIKFRWYEKSDSKIKKIKAFMMI